MFNSFIKSAAQSVVQDVATAIAGYFAATGVITSDGQQAVIGSICCLAMLGVNAYLQHTQTAKGA